MGKPYQTTHSTPIKPPHDQTLGGVGIEDLGLEEPGP